MRGGLIAIQQSLTPEAAAVIDNSIAESSRRNHGQTTPLHVAATLLAAPSGFLRQACIRSHPNSSHPLQCRALELCFSVALERLPTAQSMEPGMEPPISNALTAALKRAQAHQRRGYPEQQQQPLLAVRVELEQLMISILDDPSVSRVMREASFSSPAVKATIEQSLNSSDLNPKDLPYPHPNPRGNVTLGMFGRLGPKEILANPGYSISPSCMSLMPNWNMYINCKMKQGVAGQLENQRNDEIKKVLDILMRTSKRNPVLVGESDSEGVVKELIRRINHGEWGLEFPLDNVQVICIEKELDLDKNRLATKLKELGDLVECRIKESAGVILNMGDLKWLVEQQPVNSCTPADGVQQHVVSETGKAVMEIGMLLSRFRETNKVYKVWMIGTATCETYLRCQVYHPNLENDWDLQAVPIAARLPMPGLLPRFEVDGNLSNSIEPLIPVKSFQSAAPALLTRREFGNLDPSRNLSAYQENAEKIEQELNVDHENSSESKSESAQSSLPQWLRSSRPHNGEVKAPDQSQKDQEIVLKHNTKELHKKWSGTCLNIHNLNQNGMHEKIASPGVSPMSLYDPKLLAHQTILPKLKTCSFRDMLQLKLNVASPQESSPPENLVRTDLVLGRKVSKTTSSPENIQDTCQDTVKEFLSGVSIKPQMKFVERFANAFDAASFKKLLKGLMENAWWQPEAASAVASAVTRCPLSNGERQASGLKDNIWLLFTGPDRIGKRKMVSVLSEQICGASPTIISLGSKHNDDKPDIIVRGKTALDRIVVAVRRKPCSVIMLEDIDEADFLLRGSIKRALERGRLTDSHGREISLGNYMFVLSGNWSTCQNDHLVEETKLASEASGNWHLKLTIGEKNTKRKAHWMPDADRPTKQWKEPIFDLNQVAIEEYDKNDESHNSSSLTVDHEEEHDLETRQLAITSVAQELDNFADMAIVFKPVDFAFVRREINKTISMQFSLVVTDDNISIQVEDNALEKILGGLLHGPTNLGDWVEKALAPAFQQLNSCIPSLAKGSVIQLQLDEKAVLDRRSNGDWLPTKVTVSVDGL